MTCLLEITPEAEQDIEAIVQNINQQDSIDSARRILALLKVQLNSLADFPDSGRVGGCEGTREIVMTGLPYIIIYEISKSVVIILRVLYGADERRLQSREE